MQSLACSLVSNFNRIKLGQASPDGPAPHLFVAAVEAALRYLAPLAVIGAVVTLVGDAFAQEIPLAGRELLVAVASLATFGAVSAAAWFASRRPALAA